MIRLPRRINANQTERSNKVPRGSGRGGSPPSRETDDGKRGGGAAGGIAMAAVPPGARTGIGCTGWMAADKAARVGKDNIGSIVPQAG